MTLLEFCKWVVEYDIIFKTWVNGSTAYFYFEKGGHFSRYPINVVTVLDDNRDFTEKLMLQVSKDFNILRTEA